MLRGEYDEHNLEIDSSKSYSITRRQVSYSTNNDVASKFLAHYSQSIPT